jgi:hypothetical protein
MIKEDKCSNVMRFILTDLAYLMEVKVRHTYQPRLANWSSSVLFCLVLSWFCSCRFTGPGGP